MLAELAKNRYNNLMADIIIFIIGTVLAKAIQFLLMPLYTSVMTTEAYGVAELTNNLAELFFPIATICIYEAAFRFAVDPQFDNSVIVRTIIKVLGKSLFIGFIITLALKYIMHYKYAFYLFFVLYAYSIRMCSAYYVRGKGLSKQFAVSGIVNAISLSVFSVLFLVFFKMGEEGYLISIGLGYFVSSIYLLSQKSIRKDFITRTKNELSEQKLYAYCTPLIVYNVLYWVTTISGRYILLWYTDSSTAGQYVAAIKIASVVNMIQQAIYAAFQLNSSKVFTENGKEKYYSNVINLFITLYVVFGSVIVFITPALAKITLKNEFYNARQFLPVIMLAALISCVSSLVGTMYSTYKKTKRMVGVSVVGALVNVILGALLCPIYGIWGICIASVCCYSVQTVYKCIDVNSFSSISYEWIRIIPNTIMLVLQVLILSVWFEEAIIGALFITISLLLFNLKSMISGVRLMLVK